MKRNSFVKILLLLLVILVCPYAHAADGDGVLTAKLVIKDMNAAGTQNVYSCCYNNNQWTECTKDTKNCMYHFHTYELQYNGAKYPAYCIFPNATANGSNTVHCSKMEKDKFPVVYSLVDNYYDELMAGDPRIADLAFRIAGSVEKFNGGDVNLEEITKQKQREGEAKFTTTWQSRVQQIKFEGEWAGFYGFTLHDITAYDPVAANEGNFNELGVVQDAMDYIIKAQDRVGESGEVVYDDGTDVTKGKLFEVTALPSTKGEDNSMLYDVKSVGGIQYESITVSATRGSATLVSWDKTSGTGQIKVVPDANCVAEVSINPGTGATPTPKPTTPCPCGYEQYSCKRKKWTCPGGYYSYDPGDGKIKRLCNGGLVQEEYDSTCSRCKQCGSKKKASKTSTNGLNNNIGLVNNGFATEQELVFDNGIQLNDESDDESLTVTDAESESSKSTILYCSIGSNIGQQSYMAIIKNADLNQSFLLHLDCNNCYKGNCAPTGKPDEFLDMEVHNCCDEEATSKGRQYALNELFCDYNNGGMYIPNFATRCNAEEYEDKEPINDYCKQYCSASFYYDLPGISYAEADMYFYWDKRKLGFSGPVLNQYRRCRTLIYYDKWYDAYTTNVNAEVEFYNSAQKNYAFYNMWTKMIADKESHKTSIAATTVSCTTNWTWSESCGCDQNDSGCCTPAAGQTECTGTTTCSRNQDVTKTASVDAASIYYYPAKDYYGNYPFGVLERYGDETAGNYSYSRIRLKKKDKPTDEATYHEKSQVEAYVKAYNDAVDSACSASSASSASPHSGASAGTKTYTKLGDDYLAPRTDSETTKSSYKSKADEFTISHNNSVGLVDKLKEDLDTCGGSLGDNNTPHCSSPEDCNLYKRVQFGREPNMEFSYANKYVGIDGKEVDQEIPVNFTKVDENYNESNCITEYRSGFAEGLENDDMRYDEEFMSGSWFFGNYRDVRKYSGVRHATLRDMISIKTGKLDSVSGATVGHDWYSDYKNKDYYADKKFTTDVRARMTCRWADIKDGPVYTIVPNGIVMEDGPTEELCNMPNYNCIDYTYGHGDHVDNNAIYHMYKGVIQGEFETYFTLYDICVQDESDEKGLFDNIVHEKGLSCSGRNDLVNYSGKPTNATCILKTENPLDELYDCSGAKTVLSKDEVAAVVCCNGSLDWSNCNKNAKLTYDYKIVDPEDMFEASYVSSIGGGYAHNWVTDADGKLELEHMHKMGEDNTVYSPENLTYSFTLTPKDLRQIREYNKTRISEGGYNDFNLTCEESSNKKVLQKCKSKFLDAISGGSPLPSGSMTLELNTSTLTKLNSARNKVWRVE